MFLIIRFFLTMLPCFLITRVKYVGLRDILEARSIFCGVIFYSRNSNGLYIISFKGILCLFSYCIISRVERDIVLSRKVFNFCPFWTSLWFFGITGDDLEIQSPNFFPNLDQNFTIFSIRGFWKMEISMPAINDVWKSIAKKQTLTG